jgi:hypothetical protein
MDEATYIDWTIQKTGTLDEHWEGGQSKEMRKGMKLGEVGQLDNLKKVGQCMNPRKGDNPRMLNNG